MLLRTSSTRARALPSLIAFRAFMVSWALLAENWFIRSMATSVPGSMAQETGLIWILARVMVMSVRVDSPG